MKWMEQQSKHENTSYAVLWGLLFAAPVLSLWVRTASDSSLAFDWWEIFLVWRQLSIFLLLFLIHNFILAPLLVYRQKRWLYILLTACMVGVFTSYQCSHRPDDSRRHRRPYMEEAFDHRPDHGMEHKPEHEPGAYELDDEAGAPEPPLHADYGKRPHGPEDRPQDARPHHKPPTFVGQHDIVTIVVLILMCGMNLGIKLYFKNRKDQKKLVQLQKENLEQQLEYLKYQINPHFFMNTLNNIHALVDIDPEQAKDSIVDMSRMMRYLLYESDKQYVTLDNAVIFLKKYLNLMKLRYNDQVNVCLNVPENAHDDVAIAPLVFIPFVENAFKHGVFYNEPSTIDIGIEKKDGRLLFHCRNTKSHAKHEYGGVGLNNVTKRLELIYGNDYSLDINDGDDTYDVMLDLPFRYPSDFQKTKD